MLEAKFYPWGPEHKQMMRESPMRDHLAGFTMQGEDVPQATNRIDLDPEVRDVHGLPVARITYHPHRHELAASAHYGPKLEAILKEAGATWVRTATSPNVERPVHEPPVEGFGDPGLAPRHGHRTDGLGPEDVGVRPVRTTPRRSERRGLRLVHLPHEHGVRPHADPGSTVDPQLPGARWLIPSIPSLLVEQGHGDP